MLKRSSGKCNLVPGGGGLLAINGLTILGGTARTGYLLQASGKEISRLFFSHKILLLARLGPLTGLNESPILSFTLNSEII